MKKNTFLIWLLILIFHHNIQGQTPSDSARISIIPHASLRGQLAVFGDEVELQDNVSRVGIKAAIKKGNISFLAATELRLNLFQAASNFNVDDNENSNFLDVTTSTANNQVFSNRIGYIGLDIDKYGTITFGKQWSVYYDVTSYTDKFNVFGTKASATFIGGTDGGENGTGRANNAIVYRNQIGRFLFGIQGQLRSSYNKKLIDGFGISAQYLITPELSWGVAYNRSYLSDNLVNNKKIIGLTGQPSYYATGLNYQNKKLILSFVAAYESNGDFTQGLFINPDKSVLTPTVVFDAKGLEFYSQYTFNLFAVHMGYNLYIPNLKHLETDNMQKPLSSKFKVNNLIFGLNYKPLRMVLVYAEQRLSFGHNALDIKDQSVFALGMKIDFSKTFQSLVSIK